MMPFSEVAQFAKDGVVSQEGIVARITEKLGPLEPADGWMVKPASFGCAEPGLLSASSAPSRTPSALPARVSASPPMASCACACCVTTRAIYHVAAKRCVA
jgi:hypothetical protein